MSRFKKIDEKQKEEKIIYGNGIVDGIVTLAVSELPYVELYSSAPHTKYRSDAVKVVFNKEGVGVDVVVKVHYTQSVPDVAFKVQEAVRHSVESMTEYTISNVNVIVCGLIFNDKNVENSNMNANRVDDEVNKTDTTKDDK